MKNSVRFLRELKHTGLIVISQGEDQLERLRQEEKKLIEERSALQRQLDERVRKLAMEHRLN